MPVTIHIDDDLPVLVELVSVKKRGEQDVALSVEDLFERSSAALNSAMTAIYGMSRRVVATVSDIPLLERPDEVEVEFGLVMKTDARAFVVNAGMEAQITVKLKWQHHENRHS
ncbi:MAG: hypothetical protein JNL42_22280 [Anaerolineae bacterium]|nr:hypothetical protein [Anaerolineae bacterium]